MGYRIFMHCVLQLRYNWRTALRVSWFWWVFGILAAPIALLAIVPTEQTPAAPSPMFALIVLLGLIAVFVGLSVVAMAWHRYVLREDEFGNVLIFHSGWPVGRYIWNTLKIGLLLLLLFFPILLVMVSNLESMSVGLREIISFVLGVLGTWIFLRFGLILPAAAVGEELGFKESYVITAPIAMQLMVTSALLVIVQSVPSVLLALAGPSVAESAPIVLTLVSLPVSWINFFLGVGVLTVLYGHLVENRPI